MPPAIVQAAQNLDILPQKSKERYQFAYSQFMKWRQENNAESFSENVLCAYFAELAKKNAPNTLWTQYSMLRTTLSINNNSDITQYMKLRSFLKRRPDGYKPKKSKTLTPLEINRFINEASDDKYLLQKVRFEITFN